MTDFPIDDLHYIEVKHIWNAYLRFVRKYQIKENIVNLFDLANFHYKQTFYRWLAQWGTTTYITFLSFILKARRMIL